MLIILALLLLVVGGCRGGGGSGRRRCCLVHLKREMISIRLHTDVLNGPSFSLVEPSRADNDPSACVFG